MLFLPLLLTRECAGVDVETRDKVFVTVVAVDDVAATAVGELIMMARM